MKTIYGIVGVGLALVTAGMIFVLTKGIQKTPERILNPTYFENAGDIGHALARRFYVELREFQIVVVATSQNLSGGGQIWKEFIHASEVDGNRFETIFTVGDLPELTYGDQRVASLDQVRPKGRTLVQVPSDEDTWFKVSTQFVEPSLFLFQAPFRTKVEEANDIPLLCTGALKGVEFGCLARDASTRYYRHRLTENKLTAVMDKIEGKLHLLFVSEPR